MKTNFFRIGKKTLSIVIVMMMVISTMLVGTVTTNAATTKSEPVGADNVYYLHYALVDNPNFWDSAYTSVQMQPEGSNYVYSFTHKGTFVLYIFKNGSTYNSASDALKDVTTRTYNPSEKFEWQNYNPQSYNDGNTNYTYYYIKCKLNDTINVKVTYDPINKGITISEDTGTTSKTYTVSKGTETNGKFSVSTASATAGTTVTVNTTPDSGYEVDKVTYTYGSTTENATASETNKYTFTMPAADVKVNVTFKASTTPTTNYYIGGRFRVRVKDSSGSIHTTIEDGTYNGDWNPGCTASYFKMIENPNISGEYILETNMTTSELSQNIGSKNYNPYFIIHTGSGLSNFYGRTKDTTPTLHECQKYTSDNKVTLDNCNNSGDAAENQFLKFTDTDGTYASKGNVTLHFNPTTKEFYYTTDGTSTTDGAYKISDKTEGHGKLSISAAGKTPGTADANNEVTITVTPESYFSCTSLTVTGADKTAITTTGSGNSYTFIMPSQAVTVKATFTLDKTAYIASLGNGLWIDVDPDHSDTSSTLIKWNNYSGSNHGTSNPYTFYVPKNVDLTNAKVYNGFDSEVKLNGVSIPANSCNADTLNIPAGSTYSTSGATTESVKVMQGSTDAMFLYTTKSGSAYSLPTQINQGAIGDKITKEAVKTDGGVCKTMSNTTSTASYSGVMNLESVKGRGNSSWEASHKEFGKYAFNMKLATKTNLLGMDSAESKGAKSWCLLANNADESMLRNALTYQLASEIGLLYSPEFRFVDIYDNGEYMGSYLITEKVDVGSSKLVKGISYEDINEDYAKKSGLTGVDETRIKGKYNNNSTDNMQYAKVTVDGVTTNVPCDNTVADAKLKGKYLLEFEIGERYESEASWFTSPKGQHVVVKNPEFATKEQVTFIAQKFAAMEDKVFNNASKSELSTVMDVESFAKMYLIQEFSSNLDAASTSYYLTFDCSQANPVFVANPVWDYDWAYGQYTNTSNIGAKKPVSDNGQDAYLQTNNPEKWVAKYKSMDDSKGGSAYSIQSQLASQNSDFKSVVRKVWEETNGFYDKIQTYYADDGQIDTWYKQIKDSVDMNETRWGFIASNPISGWGSTETGKTHEAAVNYLKTDWTETRAAWLNEQFTTTDEYTSYTPDAPTIMLCDANGNAITAENPAVEKGKGFIIKVTSPVENNVVYRFFKNDGTQVGADQSDGILEFATDDLTVGETYTYNVQAVYSENASGYSNTVSVRIDDKAGNKQVTIYFKSASASAYVPSLSVDGSAPAVMTRNKKGEANSTYFGSTYSGSLKFYWFYTTMTLDTSVAHTLVFTTKDNRVNAKMSYTFSPAEDNKYYFAVNNLMGDTTLEDLTKKDEYIRNYHISATHMVYSATSDRNIGFTWAKDTEGKYKEYAMGTYLPDNNISTASLTDLTSSSLLTIPSALTPNAMLEASSAPSFFTVKSATLAQKITAEAEEVSTLQYQLLDVNLDGKVDIKDSTMMQKALAGF